MLKANAVQVSEGLLAEGRGEEALRALEVLAQRGAPDHGVLAQQAKVLKALGRMDAALAVQERAAKLYPSSAVAHHNLAATLGDMARYEAAAARAGRAFKAGGEAPQTWLVYARALFGLGRFEEAEAAFGEAIRRAPDYVEAHRELAQSVWMRTEDAGAALQVLDAARRSNPGGFALDELRATVLRFSGDVEGAYAALAESVRLHPEVASLRMAAAKMAGLAGRSQAALTEARAAVALTPGSVAAWQILCGALIAQGELGEALGIAESLVGALPFDQAVLACQATVWRLIGDKRYQALYDYAVLVRSWWLDVPDGWTDLGAYLVDLAAALERVHPFRTHPLDQSLRHGSQASNLQASADPAIRAFFQAVDGPIRRHLAALGRGDDPVRSRNHGGYALRGAWSVRLRPGGYHADHVHSEGWLSSACHIVVPPSDMATREGWLKFGQPGMPTRPALEAEYFVRPEPGAVVLFPSYMWHGTVPFSGATRLSVAFDLVPG